VIVNRIPERGRRTPRWRVLCGMCKGLRIVTAFPAEILRAALETDNRCHECDQAGRPAGQRGARP
jgi:hypothetical protein